MRFIQIIEFTGDEAQFRAAIDRYQDMAGDATFARRAVLYRDRDRPGVMVEIVEFDSFAEAMANNDLPATREWAEEHAPMLAGATFRNLDEVAVFSL